MSQVEHVEEPALDEFTMEEDDAEEFIRDIKADLLAGIVNEEPASPTAEAPVDYAPAATVRPAEDEAAPTEAPAAETLVHDAVEVTARSAEDDARSKTNPAEAMVDAINAVTEEIDSLFDREVMKALPEITGEAVAPENADAVAVQALAPAASEAVAPATTEATTAEDVPSQAIPAEARVSAAPETMTPASTPAPTAEDAPSQAAPAEAPAAAAPDIATTATREAPTAEDVPSKATLAEESSVAAPAVAARWETIEAQAAEEALSKAAPIEARADENSRGQDEIRLLIRTSLEAARESGDLNDELTKFTSVQVPSADAQEDEPPATTDIPAADDAPSRAVPGEELDGEASEEVPLAAIDTPVADDFPPRAVPGEAVEAEESVDEEAVANEASAADDAPANASTAEAHMGETPEDVPLASIEASRADDVHSEAAVAEVEAAKSAPPAIIEAPAPDEALSGAALVEANRRQIEALMAAVQACESRLGKVEGKQDHFEKRVVKLESGEAPPLPPRELSDEMAEAESADGKSIPAAFEVQADLRCKSRQALYEATASGKMTDILEGFSKSGNQADPTLTVLAQDSELPQDSEIPGLAREALYRAAASGELEISLREVSKRRAKAEARDAEDVDDFVMKEDDTEGFIKETRTDRIAGLEDTLASTAFASTALMNISGATDADRTVLMSAGSMGNESMGSASGTIMSVDTIGTGSILDIFGEGVACRAVELGWTDHTFVMNRLDASSLNSDRSDVLVDVEVVGDSVPSSCRGDMMKAMPEPAGANEPIDSRDALKNAVQQRFYELISEGLPDNQRTNQSLLNDVYRQLINEATAAAAEIQEKIPVEDPRSLEDLKLVMKANLEAARESGELFDVLTRFADEQAASADAGEKVPGTIEEASLTEEEDENEARAAVAKVLVSVYERVVAKVTNSAEQAPQTATIEGSVEAQEEAQPSDEQDARTMEAAERQNSERVPPAEELTDSVGLPRGATEKFLESVLADMEPADAACDEGDDDLYPNTATATAETSDRPTIEEDVVPESPSMDQVETDQAEATVDIVIEKFSPDSGQGADHNESVDSYTRDSSWKRSATSQGRAHQDWAAKVLGTLATQAPVPSKQRSKPGMKRLSTNSIIRALGCLPSLQGTGSSPCLDANSLAGQQSSTSFRSPLTSPGSSNMHRATWTPPSPPAPSSARTERTERTEHSQRFSDPLPPIPATGLRLSPCSSADSRKASLAQKNRSAVPGLDLAMAKKLMGDDDEDTEDDPTGQGCFPSYHVGMGQSSSDADVSESAAKAAVPQLDMTAVQLEGASRSSGSRRSNSAAPDAAGTSISDDAALPLERRSASSGDLRPVVPGPRELATLAAASGTPSYSAFTLRKLGAIRGKHPHSQQINFAIDTSGAVVAGTGKEALLSSRSQSQLRLPPVTKGRHGALLGSQRSKASVVSHVHMHHHHHYHVARPGPELAPVAELSPVAEVGSSAELDVNVESNYVDDPMAGPDGGLGVSEAVAVLAGG